MHCIIGIYIFLYFYLDNIFKNTPLHKVYNWFSINSEYINSLIASSCNGSHIISEFIIDNELVIFKFRKYEMNIFLKIYEKNEYTKYVQLYKNYYNLMKQFLNSMKLFNELQTCYVILLNTFHFRNELIYTSINGTEFHILEIFYLFPYLN